jgi:hypothetical protein
MKGGTFMFRTLMLVVALAITVGISAQTVISEPSSEEVHYGLITLNYLQADALANAFGGKSVSLGSIPTVQTTQGQANPNSPNPYTNSPYQQQYPYGNGQSNYYQNPYGNPQQYSGNYGQYPYSNGQQQYPYNNQNYYGQGYDAYNTSPQYLPYQANPNYQNPWGDIGGAHQYLPYKPNMQYADPNGRNDGSHQYQPYKPNKQVSEDERE